MKKILKVATFVSLTSLAIGTSITSFAQDSNDQKRERGNGPKRPDFATLDIDGNGEISYEEFASHEIPRGDHDTLFNHIDANTDDVITEEEFANHKPPRPERNN